MGTLPYTETTFTTAPFNFSVNERNKNAPPNVSKTYNRDGGYLFTLIKDRNVKKAFF
jgi:hypothetical protein